MNNLISSLTRVALTKSVKFATTLKYPLLQCNFGNRWKSYTAAILEEYDKPLVITKIKNNTPVGPGMVCIKQKLFVKINTKKSSITGSS